MRVEGNQAIINLDILVFYCAINQIVINKGTILKYINPFFYIYNILIYNTLCFFEQGLT